MDDVKSSIVSTAMQIKGWFEESELALLIDCVERLVSQDKCYHGYTNIVEIGSYHGRSTIAMGLTVAALNQDAVIYAIDPHEGLRTGRFDRIYHESPTYENFIRNVKYHGLEGVIKRVKSKSTETILNIPISLILIDALHLYENVREDFLHFENNLVKGSLIAFHDYQEDKFSGVFKFVNSLLSAKNHFYVKFGQVNSLIVLEKVN